MREGQYVKCVQFDGFAKSQLNAIAATSHRSAATFTQVDSGLTIEAGHTSTLAFDEDGNLWVGEHPVADSPNGGRVRVYLATDLASLR